jgi:hypothetical protein
VFSVKHKKFVKQLMGMGYSRNAAEAYASLANRMGQSYEDALAKEKLWRENLSHSDDLVQAAAKALELVVEAAAKLIEHVAACLNAIDWSALATYASEEQEKLAEGEVLADE